MVFLPITLQKSSQSWALFLIALFSNSCKIYAVHHIGDRVFSVRLFIMKWRLPGADFRG